MATDNSIILADFIESLLSPEGEHKLNQLIQFIKIIEQTPEMAAPRRGRPGRPRSTNGSVATETVAPTAETPEKRKRGRRGALKGKKDEVRRMVAQGMSAKDIAEKFGVKPGTVAVFKSKMGIKKGKKAKVKK